MIAALRALLRRIGGLWNAPAREPDLHEELAHDLEMLVEEGEARGLLPQEARRRALVKLGGMEQTMQAVRDRRTLPAVEELLQDIRFAMRQFRRRPGFTFAAVLTLTMGFAASITIFAFVDAAMIRPLPFRDPKHLAYVTETVDIMGPANLSWQDYGDWQQQSKSFDSLAVWRYAGGPMRMGDQLVPTQGMLVSANFLGTLGVRLQRGRDFTAGDNVAGAAKVMLITDGTWRNSFHGDPNIVNHPVEVNGDSYTIIGVLPKDFEFAPRGRLQYMAALTPEPGSCNARRSCHSLIGVGRLRDGVTIEQANADVKRIANALQVQYPDSNRGQGGIALPLSEEVVGKIRPVIYTLLAAALLLCAIACINVASLLLARSESRRREFALRSALGATHVRMLRQFAVESATLVFAGAAAGIAAASFCVRLFMLLVPQSMRDRMPFFDAVGLNRDTVLFAATIALGALVLFTFLPSVRISWKVLQQALAEGNASAGAGSLSWRRLGSMLVIAEISVTVVLLVGAGLLARSLKNLLHTDLNFNPAHLVTVTMDLPVKKFPEQAQRIALQRHVVERLASLPGVTDAALGGNLPVSYNGDTDWIRFPGRPYDGKHIEINGRSASATFFKTLQVPLLKGRWINDQDTAGKPRVAVVNKRFAESYFPGEDPLGKTFGDTALSPNSMKTIVGVVGDLHEGALDDPIWPAAYYSAYQWETGNDIVLRVSGGGENTLMAAIPPAIHSVDPDLGIAEIMTMSDRINGSQSATIRRGAAWLASTFAAVSLILCFVGLYGVISYSVSLRTREIGVRMALGAQRESIYAMVLREAGRLSLTGTAVGVLLSVICMSLLRAVLFQVSSWDIPTLTASCALLILCSLAACLVPARRAALSNPTEALRAE
jgi:predicted permease